MRYTRRQINLKFLPGFGPDRPSEPDLSLRRLARLLPFAPPVGRIRHGSIAHGRCRGWRTKRSYAAGKVQA
jgi:hypothetical protein